MPSRPSRHPRPRPLRPRGRRRPRDLERTYSRAQFVAKLRRLADAVESERPFAIQVAGERLHIPAAVAFNIEHERAGGEEELEFQLRWRPADA
jgi:amphi-Trp domain-containing protein